MLVYLIMYAWHASINYGFSVGGATFAALPMPTVAACEAVGRAMKEMVDGSAPPSDRINASSSPMIYRCVVVPPESPRAK